jgi:hypothetical protein
LLRSNTAPLCTATALAASTARRDPTIACTMHPSSSTARDGTISHTTACAGHGARALVGNTLVPVPASDKEHSRTVGNSTNDGSRSNTSGGRVDGLAGVGVTAKCTTIIRASIGCGTRVGRLIGTIRVLARDFAGWKRAGGVDQGGKIIHRLVLVVPESISRVAELSSKCALKVLGNGEQSKRRNEALVRSGVERLETNVVDIRLGDVQTVSNGLGKVVENLVSTVVGRDEGVVERPLEADLTHEAIRSIVGYDSSWRSNHLG